VNHSFFKRCFILLGLILLALGLPAQLSKVQTRQMMRMLQAAPTCEAVVDSLSRKDYFPDSASIPVVREALWQKLVAQAAHEKTFREGQINTCHFRPGMEGRFSFKRKGVTPARGYPVYIALHGGGGGPQEMNDEQWEQMQSYYWQSIDTGIYIAPRGIHDTWNLHFDDEAQAFFKVLLQDLRLCGGIDPDRVYLLGYSAGGDGVYQLAPRFASQLAAASMSAGHHNGVHADNLEHLPMLLQVGELDEDYDRNKETVRYSMILDSLQNLFPGEFLHQVYLHAAAEHSYVMDRRGSAFMANVIASPVAWLKAKALPQTLQAVTDAPTWLRAHRRDAHPRHIRWDAATRTAGCDDFYWLSVGQADAGQVIEVWADPAQNSLRIAPFKGELRIHLHEALFHPAKPIKITVGSQAFTLQPRPSMLEMAKTIFATIDPAYCAWQTVRVWSDGKGRFSAQ
jgi:dienelactone hydrolase